MANLYVRSSNGSDADNGSTWALAKATAAGAAAIDAAGDTIYFASTHDETGAAAMTLAFAGTAAAPVRLISANDAAEPPTASAAGAAIRNSGANAMTISGTVYGHGLTFQSGGGSSAHLNLQGTQTYEACAFIVDGTSNAVFAVGNASNGKNYVRLRECNVKLTQTTARIDLQHGAIFNWDGGSLLAGSACVALFAYSGAGNTRGGTVLASGVDLSAAPTAMNIVPSTGLGNAVIRLRNCKLPAGWTGQPVQSGSTEPALRVELSNCSSGADNIGYWLQEPLCGEIRSNATVYADDFGTGTAHSLRFASGANTSQVNRLVGPDLIVSVTAGTYAASVEVVTDGVTLTDSEAWLEVMAMSSSGSPLGVWASDKLADPLATPANQATSALAWTTTGLASPVTQKLSVSVSPVLDGYLIGRVVLAKSSTVVYVDPSLRVA